MHLGPEEPDYEGLIVTLRAIASRPEDFTPAAISISTTMAADALEPDRRAVEPCLPHCEGQMAMFEPSS
jgi:hypothetical protein